MFEDRRITTERMKSVCIPSLGVIYSSSKILIRKSYTSTHGNPGTSFTYDATDHALSTMHPGSSVAPYTRWATGRHESASEGNPTNEGLVAGRTEMQPITRLNTGIVTACYNPPA